MDLSLEDPFAPGAVFRCGELDFVLQGVCCAKKKCFLQRKWFKKVFIEEPGQGNPRIFLNDPLKDHEPQIAVYRPSPG